MAGTQITRAQKQEAVTALTAATAKQGPLLKAMRISEDAFSRVLINALMKQPQLALCTRDSLFQAVFTACDIGLMPDGRHGAIVPIKKGNVLTADFWPMVGGLLTCVRRELKSVAIQAHNVFQGDEFIDERGTSPRLFHRPSADADRLSEAGLVCSYATVHFAGNAVAEFEVMYRQELQKFKKDNRGPWSTHPLEMYRVRPLKRVLKRLPISAGSCRSLTAATTTTSRSRPATPSRATSPSRAKPGPRTTRRRARRSRPRPLRQRWPTTTTSKSIRARWTPATPGRATGTCSDADLLHQWRRKERRRGTGPVERTFLSATSRFEAREKFKAEKPETVVLSVHYYGRSEAGKLADTAWDDAKREMGDER